MCGIFEALALIVIVALTSILTDHSKLPVTLLCIYFLKILLEACCCAKNCTAKHNFGTHCHLSQHLSIKLFTIASFRIKYHIKHVTSKY